MRKRILAMLLAVTMCTELLAGCGTAAVAVTAGAGVAVEKNSATTDELQQDNIGIPKGDKKKPQAQLSARPAYYYMQHGASGNHYISGRVRTSKPTDIISKIINKLPYESLEGKVKPVLENATVTLVDKTGNPCLDTKGKKQRATTDENGLFTLRIDASEKKELTGPEAYETTYYIKIEKRGYRPIVEEVVHISVEDFKQETERYQMKEVLPQVQEILDNTRDGVEALYLEGEQQALDKAKYHETYSLSELKAGREEIRTGAEQLMKTFQTEEGKKAFWDRVNDEMHRSWGEWFQEMYDELPERWKLYILSARVHMLDVNTFNSHVSGAAEGQEAARTEIAKKIEELNATTPIWKDDEFWNFTAAIAKEIGIWIALDYATAGLGHWARMYGLFTRGAKAYEVLNAGVALSKSERGHIWLTEPQVIAVNRIAANLQKTEEGTLIWKSVEKSLEKSRVMGKSVHPEELQKMLLKALDEKIAAKTEKANGIRAAAQAAKETRMAELEAKVIQIGERVNGLKQAAQSFEQKYLERVPENIRALIKDVTGSAAISGKAKFWDILEIQKKGEEFSKLHAANHETGHALAMALDNYDLIRLKKVVATGWIGMPGCITVTYKEGTDILSSGDRLIIGISGLGSIVAEQRIYGKLATTTGKTFRRGSDFFIVRKYFTRVVEEALAARGSVILPGSKECKELTGVLIAEYYHRMDMAFGELQEAGIFPFLAKQLAERETIKGSEYMALTRRLLQEEDLTGLCGEHWRVSESLEEGIAIQESLYKVSKEQEALQHSLATVKETDGLTPDELVTLASLDKSVTGFKSTRSQVAAWDTSLARGAQVTTMLDALKEGGNLHTTALYLAVAYLRFAELQAGIEKVFYLDPLEGDTMESVVTPSPTPAVTSTVKPTTTPKVTPSPKTTDTPKATPRPTVKPTPKVTSKPTVEPTSKVINTPAVTPTVAPTVAPTIEATSTPVISPTSQAMPGMKVTTTPTVNPTVSPMTSPAAI